VTFKTLSNYLTLKLSPKCQSKQFDNVTFKAQGGL